MNRNSSIEVLFHWEDGTTTVRKHRNSVGGFARMMDRVAEEHGTDRVRVFLYGETGDDATFIVAGRKFTVETVEVAR